MTDAHNDIHGDDNIIPLSVLGKGGWLVVKIMGPLFIGAILIVAFCVWKLGLPLNTAIIFMGVSFTLMAFIAIPLWLATIEDELHGEDH